MFAFLKFCFLCALAIASGVFAVSVPVAGRTTAEHVRRLVRDLAGVVEDLAAEQVPAPPRGQKVARKAPADRHTDEERAALDELIGEKNR